MHRTCNALKACLDRAIVNTGASCAERCLLNGLSMLFFKGGLVNAVKTDELMRQVFDSGADGMTVNFPDRLQAYMLQAEAASAR